MKARKRNTLIAALIAVLMGIGVATTVYAFSFSNGAYTYRTLFVSAPKVSVGWSTQPVSLTGNATTTVITGLWDVENCEAQIVTYMSATPSANIVRCVPADQTAAATRGKIYLQAGIIGMTATGGVRWTTSATGTSDVVYQLHGYGIQ